VYSTHFNIILPRTRPIILLHLIAIMIFIEPWSLYISFFFSKVLSNFQFFPRRKYSPQQFVQRHPYSVHFLRSNTNFRRHINLQSYVSVYQHPDTYIVIHKTEGLYTLWTGRYGVRRPVDAIYLFLLQNLTDLLRGTPRFPCALSPYPKVKLNEPGPGH
jgi:hypothetical protein